jgi:hypothetical protein
MRKPATRFQQIPVELAKELVTLPLSQNSPTILYCRFCQKPVSVDTAKTDSEGKAIHEHCYLADITGKMNSSKTRRGKTDVSF